MARKVVTMESAVENVGMDVRRAIVRMEERQNESERDVRRTIRRMEEAEFSREVIGCFVFPCCLCFLCFCNLFKINLYYSSRFLTI